MLWIATPARTNQHRHCEERSDVAIQSALVVVRMLWIATPARTLGHPRGGWDPVETRFSGRSLRPFATLRVAHLAQDDVLGMQPVVAISRLAMTSRVHLQ